VIHAPAELLQQLPTAMRLDGELFLGRGRFQECMSIVRSHVPDADRWTQIGFMVFDAPDLPLPFKQRIDKVNEALSADGWACAIEQHRCKGRDDVERALGAVLALGGEGLVLRHPFKPYEGGRTGDLLKVKPTQDAECIVVGHEEGTGRNRGRLGALVCADEQSVIFRIGTGFKDAMRDHPPLIGTRVTYRYQEKTLAGKPRHPVFQRIRPEE
jgi:DNA ligase-1